VELRRRNAEAIKAAARLRALNGDGKALRREVHNVLKQVSYDYERMQYNTVVSGAMKLLNALEGFKAGATAACAKASVLLRVLYPATPHITHGCGRSWATPANWATCSTPPGPGGRGRAGAGRDRADAAGQRQAARRGPVPAGADKAAIEAAALATGVREVQRRQGAQEGRRRAGPSGHIVV
jgi:leucyl-tRNA synthetase